MSRPVTLIPSIASGNPLHLSWEIDRLEGIPNLHIDIEDGNFVPNITFGIKTVKFISEYTKSKMSFDAHLLVKTPDCWISSLATCGIHRVAVSIEALPYPLETLSQIRRHGMEAGICLNFKTPAEMILPFTGAYDYVIVMTAEPDGQGTRFYPGMLEKIRKLAGVANTAVWADGGIDRETLPQVIGAGASTVILGRAIFEARDPAAAFRELTGLAKR